jgi:beta-phosphoglucomutase
MPVEFQTKKGVLLDLDGTLIDSMPLHYRCWSETLERFGVSVDIEHFYASEGTKITDLMKKYTGIQEPSTIADLVREKDALFLERFSFSLYEGVREFLSECISLGVKLGLVTASSADRFNKSAPKSFREHFSVIITGDALPRGKPHPDPYLAGMRGLDLDPEHVLAVENAPLGITAAKAAGLQCVALAHTLGQPFLNEADYTYENFQDFASKFCDELRRGRLM